jgi:hypothetical protein
VLVRGAKESQKSGHGPQIYAGSAERLFLARDVISFKAYQSILFAMSLSFGSEWAGSLIDTVGLCGS